LDKDVAAQFALFVEKVDGLRSRRLNRSRFEARISITLSEGKILNQDTHDPDEEDFRSYLLTFRQFILNNSHVNLNRIYNLCQQHMKNGKIKQMLAETRRDWKNLNKGVNTPFVFLYEDDRKWTPREVFELWINGLYFHPEPEKRNMLNAIHEKMKPSFRLLLIWYVFEASQHIFMVGQAVQKALSNGTLEQMGPSCFEGRLDNGVD